MVVVLTFDLRLYQIPTLARGGGVGAGGGFNWLVHYEHKFKLVQGDLVSYYFNFAKPNLSVFVFFTYVHMYYLYIIVIKKGK